MPNCRVSVPGGGFALLLRQSMTALVHCKCIESAIVNKRVVQGLLAILTRNLRGLWLAGVTCRFFLPPDTKAVRGNAFNYASFVNTVCDLKNNTNAILVRPQSSGK